MPEKDDIEALRAITDVLKDFDAKDQERILRWTREKLGLSAPTPDNPPKQPVTAQPPGAAAQPAPPGRNLKAFVNEKKPKNDVQFAATVAYFHRFEAPEELRKSEIGGDDLTEACRLAGRERLLNPGQTLLNAHKLGLLDRVNRGTFTINSVGENLVAMTLPSDGTAVKSVQKKKGKKKTVKKAK